LALYQIYEKTACEDILMQSRNNKFTKEDFENLSFERLKKRVLMEQEGKCNKCGISEWFGISLSLELEHKDGNNQNNNRENLEVICPNCHSITDTWKGRNIINKKNKIDDDKLYELYKEEYDKTFENADWDKKPYIKDWVKNEKILKDPKLKEKYVYRFDVSLGVKLFTDQINGWWGEWVIVNPKEINHKDASSLRNPNDRENNLTNVYDVTFKQDYDYFYKKWEHREIFEKPDYNTLVDDWNKIPE
jgi:hypothetical protein